ncbi:MAG: M48 family metallopeptidase [Phycisphaerales bacterium]
MRWAKPLAAFILAVQLMGCSTNPATGEKQLNWVSADREKALGAEAAPEFVKQYGGDIPSNAIQQYVSDLGHKLAAVSERPDLEWEFHAVDSSVINAFALPGGKVFITRGLMQDLQNEAQLAGVLGHEVGHVTAQHIGQQMTRAMIITGIGVGVGVAGEQSDNDWMKVLGVGTSVGGGLYMLSYGRDQETQADELGVRYMSRLGYNPIGQIQVMKVLKRASGSGGGGMEILSTHPLPDTRIRHLNEYIKDKYPDYDDPQKYRINRDRYQRSVLDVLKKLPPPRHDGSAQ